MICTEVYMRPSSGIAQRGGYRLVIGCQLSVIGCQLSVIGYQLSVIGYQLSVVAKN